jgi:hypothetical protein
MHFRQSFNQLWADSGDKDTEIAKSHNRKFFYRGSGRSLYLPQRVMPHTG